MNDKLDLQQSLRRLFDFLDEISIQGENTEKTYRTIIITEPLLIEIKEIICRAAQKIEDLEKK